MVAEAAQSEDQEHHKQVEKSHHLNDVVDDINLSDLDDDNLKREFFDLELQIDNESLTRGERRRLQNKRNLLKTKIKKELESESHKVKIYRL